VLTTFLALVLAGAISSFLTCKWCGFPLASPPTAAVAIGVPGLAFLAEISWSLGMARWILIMGFSVFFYSVLIGLLVASYEHEHRKR